MMRQGNGPLDDDEHADAMSIHIMRYQNQV